MIIKICSVCGKEFQIRNIVVKLGGGKYCSKSCQIQGRTTKVLISCKICKKEFYSQPHRFNNGRGIYCSKECQKIGLIKLVKIICIQCGKEFFVKPNKVGKTKYCSQKCNGLSRRGENHPMHIEGSPTKNYGDSWQRQRKAAVDRDNHRCVICGKHEKELAQKTLHVHHKIRRRFFTDEIAANDLSNLITLCISCHRKVEDGRIVLN